jgi:hypothetical protein
MAGRPIDITYAGSMLTRWYSQDWGNVKRSATRRWPADMRCGRLYHGRDTQQRDPIEQRQHRLPNNMVAAVLEKPAIGRNTELRLSVYQAIGQKYRIATEYRLSAYRAIGQKYRIALICLPGNPIKIRIVDGS